MLNFDAESHTYTMNEKVLPSVSEICDRILGSSYGGIPEEVLRKAADFGTEIHEAIEAYNDIGLIKAFDEPLKTHCLDNWITLGADIKPLKNEVRGHYKHYYAGTFDMIGEEDGKTYLYDYKTTYDLHEERVSLQLSLYRLMYGWDDIDGVKVVWLPKRKKGLIKELLSWDKEALIATIESALNVQEVPIDMFGGKHD